MKHIIECIAKNNLHVGTNFTKGLGAGGQSEMGAKATQEDNDQIRQSVTGSDMVFITAGLGGSTGGAPILAQICKEIGALTVAVVTKPFLVVGFAFKHLCLLVADTSNHINCFDLNLLGHRSSPRGANKSTGF